MKIIGEKFVKLKPLRKIRGSNKYLCACDCGNKKEILKYNFTSGNTKSCGCLRRQHGKIVGLENVTHNGTGTKLFYAYCSIKQRCENKNHASYKYYGARGIKLSKEWSTFSSFKRDMEKSYLKHVKEHGEGDTTIERIDVNKSYSKSNCCWATRKEQARNRTNSRCFSYNGETKCVSEWAEEYGLKSNVLWNRIFLYEWDISKALNK